MSSTSNDRLTKLPAEILREIIVQLETKSSIDLFFEAYPSILSLYSSYERGILEGILANLLANDVEGNIRKDVLAIVEFSNPKGEFCLQFRKKGRTPRVKPEELQWPDWPQSPETGYLQQVHRLLSRIIAFIEDYISKATSEYPPRAYLGLPDLKTGETSFMGSLLETRFLPFTSLRRSERYRLLRAFVRYELLCEIHNTRDDRWDVPDEFQNFNALGTPNAPDPKALLSVHEYYIGLYGAVFAHCSGDAWLPDLPSSLSADAFGKATKGPSLKYRPLLFPDNLFFDAEGYYDDLYINGSRVAEELAGCGLDLLVRVLSCLEQPGSPRYIKHWVHGLTDEQKYEFAPWIEEQYDPRHDKEYSAYRELIMSSRFSDELPKSEERIKSMNEYLLSNGGTERWFPHWHEAHKLQLRIYRQRAWGFFDDQRFYPNKTCHFPTLESLVDLQSEEKNSKATQEEPDERGKRRSKHWQDYLAGIRPDKPMLMAYPCRRGLRFFDDAVAPGDLPWIGGEYQHPDGWR
ncbi:uncharacterized protein B0J16DRAFT_162188 [Fusarium flagelliforme]|uniref:Uncharacterized protein n=1 Tax=Fusarium flagelliforme TaxID=2675880 RepID=A0A395N4D0_9HYPO|nr:uncharacterized protein B0J16DRAFT_162188 [Fusarium flagelliforme]KAH7183121.1 hypothetical protein B0J16DRAFT_162188 [Fusarium flagelliforme]RFN54988.1 hypothetical protein FIE12Z_671 [Fusarium flagelliforme]